MSERESFVFYRSFYESINALDKTTQLELYNAICEYSLNGSDPKLESPVSNAVFTLMKVNLDRANARYKASVENGKKGGRPRKINNLEKPSNNLEKPNQNLNDNVNDNDNVNVNYKETTKESCSCFLEQVQNEFLNITPMQYEQLIELENKYGTDLCIEALKVCSNNNKKTINYLKGVLKNWNTFEKKKSIKPEWLDQEIKSEEMNQEEVDELESLFREFN